MSENDGAYVAVNLELRVPNFDPRIGDEVITRVGRELAGRPWWFLRYWQSGPHIRFRAMRAEDAEAVIDSVTRAFAHCSTTSWQGITEVSDREYRAAVSDAARQGEGRGELECLPLSPLGVRVRPFESEEARYGGEQGYRAAIRAFSASSISVALTLESRPDLDARTRYLLGAAAMANFYGRAAEIAGAAGVLVRDSLARPSGRPSEEGGPVPARVVEMMTRMVENPRPDALEHLDSRLPGPSVKDVLSSGHAPVQGAYLRAIIHTTCNRLGLPVEAEGPLRRTALALVHERGPAS